MEFDWYFLNYGYVPLDSTVPRLTLQDADEPDRLFIQLYEAILGDVSLSGSDVLEVGSGRGGGSSYIARYRRPRRIVGIDRSEEAVALCRKHHRAPNLAYERDDAEALDRPDSSFDVVLNVESSHCYGSMARFVSEVKRVLKPGGIFCWGDFRNTSDLPKLEKVFAESGLSLITRVDITENIVRALDEIHDRKLKAIEERSPKLFLKTLKEFAAVKDSAIYREFVSREKTYLVARFRKN